MTQPFESSEVDWAAAEEKLVREATIGFREIAIEYRDVEFYGVCFECDLVYTAVQAHANSEDGLRNRVTWRKEECEGCDFYRNMTIEQAIEKGRWDIGDWHYFPIFPTPDFADIAAAFQQLTEKVGEHRAVKFMKEGMMEMACRAVVRLERAGAFDGLRRTPDFRVLCIYREPCFESDEESAQRLNRVRESFAGGA